MDKQNIYMMGVIVDERCSEAPEVQKVFTKYGGCILSRLGIHECSDTNGFISLNVRADEDYIRKFEDELTSIDGVSVKHMLIK